MKCPKCFSAKTKVTCTEHTENRTKRYCRCLTCSHRFRTFETYQYFICRGNNPNSRRIGELNNHAVLTKEDVKEMRKLNEVSKWDIHKLVKRYGMTKGHIYKIINYRAWKHLS